MQRYTEQSMFTELREQALSKSLTPKIALGTLAGNSVGRGVGMGKRFMRKNAKGIKHNYWMQGPLEGLKRH